MSRRQSIIGGAAADKHHGVAQAPIDSLYHQSLREEMGRAADAARGPARTDWRDLVMPALLMLLLAAAVLGGLYLYRNVDVRSLAFHKPVEVESVTDRAARIADRLRRPEDTTPLQAREPLLIDLSAERAAKTENEGPAPESE